MENFNIKTKQEVKYFEKNINDFQNLNNDENSPKSEKIQLVFNLMNGKTNYSYGIKLVNQDNELNNSSIVSEMKKCSNSNALNLLKYNFDYFFGKEQKIQLELIIKDINEYKSFPIFTTLGEIVGNKNSTKYYFVNGMGEEKLEIKAQKQNTKKQFVTIHFNLEISSANLKVSKSNQEDFFKNITHKLYFKIVKKNKILYESETFTDDGKFNMVQIPINILNSDFSIIFFNYKNHNIGKIDTNVNIITNPKNKKKIIFSKQLSLNEKLNIYNFSSIRDEITFLDYIKKGVRVALDIGIDFTGSNGHPDDIGTLHCRLKNVKERNPYERAILSCAKIMANYDYDQLFPVYGFGAIINDTQESSWCFNINFKEDPNIQFVDNIIKVYYECLDKITFSGPTFFSPIINKIVEDIKKENDILEYHVLMILTDGIIDDMEETIDALVEGSFLPLSVIIVGIGDADFTKMNVLDGDNDKPIISSKGVKRQRDLVQFVPFNQFEGDEKRLTEEILDEIPRQIIEYYTLNFLYPELLLNNSSFIEDKEPQDIKQDINNNESINLFRNSSYILHSNHPNNEMNIPNQDNKQPKNRKENNPFNNYNNFNNNPKNNYNNNSNDNFNNNSKINFNNNYSIDNFNNNQNLNNSINSNTNFTSDFNNSMSSNNSNNNYQNKNNKLNTSRNSQKKNNINLNNQVYFKPNIGEKKFVNTPREK